MAVPALRMLALDAALNNIGYVVFDMPQFDVIEPVYGGLIQQDIDKDKRAYQQEYDIARTGWIFGELMAAISAYKPNALSMELLSGSQSAKTSNCFGMVTGVMGCVCQTTKLPLQYLVGVNIKKEFTGNRSASKDDMLEVLLQISPDFCAQYLPRQTRGCKGKSAYARHGLLADAEHIVDAFAIGYTAASTKATRALFAMRQSLGG